MPRCDTASTNRLCSGGVHTRRGRFRACAWSSSEPVESSGRDRGSKVEGRREVRASRICLIFFPTDAPYGRTRDGRYFGMGGGYFVRRARTLESHGHAGLLARSLERLEASGVFHASLVRHHVLEAHVRIQVACGEGGRSAVGQISRLSRGRDIFSSTTRGEGRVARRRRWTEARSRRSGAALFWVSSVSSTRD